MVLLLYQVFMGHCCLGLTRFYLIPGITSTCQVGTSSCHAIVGQARFGIIYGLVLLNIVKQSTNQILHGRNKSWAVFANTKILSPLLPQTPLSPSPLIFIFGHLHFLCCLHFYVVFIFQIVLWSSSFSKLSFQVFIIFMVLLIFKIVFLYTFF